MMLVGVLAMARVEDVLWQQDLDLSGGPAGLEASLIGGQRGGYVIGDETINAVKEQKLRIVRIMTADESSNVARNPGDIALQTRLLGDIVLPASQLDEPGIYEPLGGVALPSGEQMNVLGNGSGAGAEQHAVAVRIMNPNQPEVFTWEEPPADSDIYMVEMPTDAHTADTMDNPVEISGRTNNYAQGQTSISDDPDVTMWLVAATPQHIAGQSGFFITDPSETINLCFLVPALGNKRFDFVKEFGGAFKMTGANPIKVGGIGTVTTAIPLILEIAVTPRTGR